MQRYTQNSPEIDSFRAVIDSYDNKNWDDLVSKYADTAKVFFNSAAPIEIVEIPAYHQNDDKNLSQRGFEKEGLEYEMVVDDKGRIWVNFWGTWKGTLAANGKQIELPVHLTAQFIDGKIVSEYGYWDNAPIVLALQDIEAQNMMSDEGKMINETLNNITKAWNTNDKDLMYSSMEKNVVRTANGVIIASDQAGYGNFMDIFHGGFPDFHVTIDDVSFKNNKAYVDWSVTGTNTGKFMDNAPTNKKIKTHGFSVWSFNGDGKATQEDAFYDNLEVYKQLGISPK